MLDLQREQSYREALYRLLERNRTTRAALYLMEPTGEFRLAAQYGFSPRELPLEHFGKGHPLVDRVNHFRRPFFVNSPSESEELRTEMEKSRTARMLVAPIYESGRLVGILDARDKAGGDLFTNDDMKVIGEVAAEILRIDTQGQRRAEPSEPRDDAADLIEPVRPLPSPPTFPPISSPEREPARSRPTNAEPAPKIGAPAQLTQREVMLFRGFVAALLMNPSVAAVSFSLWLENSADFYIGARGPLADPACDALVASASDLWKRMFPNRPPPPVPRINFEFPHGTDGPMLRRDDIAVAQTSAVDSQEGRTVLFTVALGREPGEDQTRAIREIHLLVRRAVGAVRDSVRYREAFRGMLQAYLEPGVKKLSALVSHSVSVARVARRFAEHLKLSEAATEQITVAALLHDVGMRELAYDRLSEKRPLTDAEYQLARDHPAVGAMLLASVNFPYPIVPLIRHHHERYDGAGYPDRLHGERIPFGARLIHIVEAFDAMTSPASYRPTIARDEALEVIVSKGGTQFDPDLAEKFRDFVGSGGLEGG